MTHELVIRGGSVVDGTGAPAMTADVAIDDGRITEIGAVDGVGTREVDADGAPGDDDGPRGVRPGGLVRF